MTIGNTLTDTGGIPLSSVISPGNTGQTSGGNVTPVPLQGHPGSFLDSAGNPSTAATMAYLYPLVVQKGHSVTGSAGKTLTFTFANNNNQGNSIICCVGLGEVESGSSITLAVTDSQGNTYTECVKASQSTTLEAAIFLATNIKAGANTVTATIAGASSTNTAIAMQVYEVWGPVQLSGALDITGTGNNAGSTSPATGAIVPYVPNEFAVAAISAAGGTITAGTNWTLDSTSLAPTGGNLVSFGAESQSLTTFASLPPSASLSASNAWAMCAATFKPIIVPVSGPMALAYIYGGLAQANQVPVSNAGPQGLLTVSGSLTANSDNSLTFSGNSTVARRIRLQNESAGTIYWNADTAASTGSPSLAAPAANAVMVEWINQQITTLHIWIPTGGTTVLNGSGGVKVSAWA